MAEGNWNGNPHKGVGNHSSIDIGNLNRVVASIKEKAHNVSPSPFGKTSCIYRIHKRIRKVNEFAYMPETVAIGPFHHGKESLQLMEDHKLRYLNGFLARITPKMQGPKLQELVQAIKGLEDRSRKSYSEPLKFNSDKFVEMMVIDGLFIIELLRKNCGEVEKHRDDPIFNTVWGLSSLMRDMILLENQLPMFVLESLFNQITIPSQNALSLKELILHFFNPLMPRDDKILIKYSNSEGKHLLDLLVNSMYPSSRRTELNRNLQLKFLPSVTELRRAGIKFKAGSTIDSFLDIKFSKGVLEIPPIIVQDQTESVLRNFIALEQCYNGQATLITSYAFLMDSLINSEEDARILCQKGIILNYLGDDEDVSSLFNKLCYEVSLVNFYFPELCEKVNAHYKTRWHVWKATLKRDYFDSPWAFLSFFAAILLLVLTIIGTLFTILSYADSHGKRN